MPVLARLFVKAGLIHFVLALLAGASLQFSLLFDAPLSLMPLQPVYVHLFVVGWITQMIMGVSFWMFPTLSREEPRGREGMGWFVFLGLNTGLLLRAVGEPMNAWEPAEYWRWLLVASAALHWLAGVFYVRLIWGRVKGK
jgi:hypothetical protein